MSIDDLVRRVQSEWGTTAQSIRELQSIGPLGEGNTSTGIGPQLIRDAIELRRAVTDLGNAVDEVLAIRERL